YTSQEGGFSVSMPSGAQEASNEIKGDGLQLTAKGLGVESGDGKTGYLAGFMPLTAEILKGGSDRIFGNFKNGITQKTGAKVIAESPISLGNDPGREYVVSGPGQATTYLRTYLVQDRLYVLIAYAPDINPSAPEYTNFFDSFKLTNR